jgi:CheY-like chemotaxis protein
VRLLLVENHPVFAKTVAVEVLGAHEVVACTSIAEAAAFVRGDAFDAVLVDYDLDDGKGSVLVLQLRAQGYRLPIIAISAHEMGNAALLAAGATAVCPKLKFDEIGAVLCSARASS